MPQTYAGETAIAALRTKLLTIVTDTGTTWANTIAPDVVREAEHQRGARRLPIIVLGRHRDDFTWHAQGQIYRVVSTFDISYLFDTATWNPDTDASKASHDIIKAIGRDYQLGQSSYVQDCRVVSIHPVLPTQDDDPLCGIRATVELSYFISATDPSQGIS